MSKGIKKIKSIAVWKQATALFVTGAFLFSSAAPAFTAARRNRDYVQLTNLSKPVPAHTLRKDLISNNPKAEERIRQIIANNTPTSSHINKETLERGIEFFQKLLRRNDSPGGGNKGKYDSTI